ncbi:uncharacterized SAM-binding protein YcdF (DUF218 family) [Streptacidiphilus sp. MAP12-33]|uniref:YdcF family protein n=1 Tax=Streptacidiphilus sp. MAP12-33 TaxID=3156266 RepID=UPI00351627B8
MLSDVLFALAALLAAAFLVSVLRDRRRFRNAVLLGLTVVFAGLGALFHLAHAHSRVFDWVVVLAALACFLGACLLTVFLLFNGVQMVRKEGRSPAHLLSLLTGVAIAGLMGLTFVTLATGSRLLALALGPLLLVTAYIAFLFLSFLGYALLYGALPVRGAVDFVVVLGSGLVGGTRVPPLLASRLDRGWAVADAQERRTGAAVRLVTSGGQGPGEDVPEAVAMAGYLTERGFPPERLVREERSRTTEENLRFSHALMAQHKPDYRCVVVTNNFHAFRAAITARRVGVPGQVVGSHTARYFLPSATLREFVAVFVAYRAVNLPVCGILAGLGALFWLR